MRRYIHTIAAFASAALMAACSADEATTANPSAPADAVYIDIEGIGMPQAGPTRAEGADTYASSLPADSHIGVYIYDNTGTDISTEQVYLDKTTGDTKTSALWIYKTVGEADAANKSVIKLDMTSPKHTLNPRYPYTGTTPRDYVSILAMFPYKAGHTPSASPLAYDFKVSLDQRDAANVAASDLISTGIVQKTFDDCNGKKLNLDMYHQTARVKVVFQPKAGSDLTADNMPEEFSVLNVCHTLQIDPKADTGTGFTKGIATLASAGTTTEADPLKGSTAQSFLIPPQTVAEGTALLKFDIKSSGLFKGISGAKFLVPTGGATFEAGKAYQITVTVDVDFISLTGTITGWVEETFEAIGHPYDDFYNSKDNVIL